MAIPPFLKKLGNILSPPPSQSADGRDQWGSRASFLLAAMGGCAGMGNLIRYPSQVYNNNGLQWFIPYLMCVFLIAIPALILEVAIGQAYRGGSVVAFNNIHHRLKGQGFSLLYIGFMVSPYFVVNLSWIMIYFRNSFQSPLPWEGRAEEYYYQDVVQNVDAIPGNKTSSGVTDYVQYPGTALIGETVGWTAFVWFLVWISIFRGIGQTGRVVYFTMGLPVILTIILVGRSVSLPNAGRGIKLYFGEWNGEKLASGDIWQTAAGQVFFSTGVGFGYFSSYASYNQKHANAVMDSCLIVCSNVLFEGFAAFAAFGVVGYLDMMPVPGERIGAFTIGFLTLPTAITQLPGSSFWAFALFFTLVVLGYSSAFAMVDAVVTLVMDTKPKIRREWVVTGLVVVSFLISLPYCTQFGYALLTGVDRWINDVALVFVVFGECAFSTTFYRWRDVAGQVGKPSFFIWNFGYFGGMVLGVAVAHAVQAEAGAGVGFGIFIVCSIVSCVIGKTPDDIPPALTFGEDKGFVRRFIGKSAALSKFFGNVFVRRFWYMAFYSGQQLRRDLNVIVATGKNWSIPAFWPILLRFLSAPVLAIIYGFAYPAFYELRDDPLHILGFGLAHICLILIGLGVLLPRWYNTIIPPDRREEGKLPYAPNVLLDGEEPRRSDSMEAAEGPEGSEGGESEEKKRQRDSELPNQDWDVQRQ
ncbi:Ff.00g104780.m01.CDS01 [Fusarium sp. VM40]|nr:Ff.00g104780.m01.CDS01 [Fusarium sp. VM40]